MGIKVGCCGFSRAQAKYYERYSLLEVQKTFYKPPQLKTVERWREQAPDNFEFTLKAWQLITHEPSSPTYAKARLQMPEDRRHRYGSFRPTDEVFVAWEETRRQAEALRARLVIFQCPASFTPSHEHKENMRDFFRQIERGDLILAWEPRGKWGEVEIKELCQELDLVHCVDPFKGLPVWGDLAYFRLHGRRSYYYNYTDADLQQLLEWCRAYEDAYCLFNNVSMWDDGLRMKELVEKWQAHPKHPGGVRSQQTCCSGPALPAAGHHAPPGPAVP